MARVLQTRGGHLEAVHPFSAVAVVDGQVVDRIGPVVRSPWRSSAKPFQLWCSLDAIGEAPFSDEELAVGASSHTGEPAHVGLVAALLARYGLDAGLLRCGAHWPLHHPAGEEVIRAGGSIGPIFSNCSGKHTFMLVACQRRGWALDYRDLAHPLQQRVAERVAALSHEGIEAAVDGCGVPTFLLSIDGMARAWGQLAEAAAGQGDPALGRIGRAMMAHPGLTSGTGRLDRDVMAGAREGLVVKIGAGGVFCLGLPARGMGIAVKVHSGVGEALPTAVAASLERFAPGAWRRPEGWGWEEVRNVVGRGVGAYTLQDEAL